MINKTTEPGAKYATRLGTALPRPYIVGGGPQFQRAGLVNEAETQYAGMWVWYGDIPETIKEQFKASVMSRIFPLVDELKAIAGTSEDDRSRSLELSNQIRSEFLAIETELNG